MTQPKPLAATELKAFIPSRDFALSQQFYLDLGFTRRSQSGGVAYFCVDQCAFLLQDYYVREYADNCMMHLQVEDVAAWHAQVLASVAVKYGTQVSAVVEQPWHMRDFTFCDPSGVLWRIAQLSGGLRVGSSEAATA